MGTSMGTSFDLSALNIEEQKSEKSKKKAKDVRAPREGKGTSVNHKKAKSKNNKKSESKTKKSKSGDTVLEEMQQNKVAGKKKI